MFPKRIYYYSALFSIGLVLWVYVVPSQAERRVDFQSSNCTFNPKYFKNFTVSVVNKTLSMDLELAKPIQRGLKSHLDYQLRIPNAKHFQTIFSYIIDVCATVSTIKDGLFKSSFKSISKNGNIIASCPVQVGYYYFHNWKMSSTMTHKFLQPGEYRGVLNFFYGKYKSKAEDRVLTLTIDSILYE